VLQIDAYTLLSNSLIDFAGVNENVAKEIPKMDARLAEVVVRKWQDVKAQALGPSHCLEKLPEVSESLRMFFRQFSITFRRWHYMRSCCYNACFSPDLSKMYCTWN